MLIVALEDVLSEFLSKMHPSKAHQLLLTRLITSSPVSPSRFIGNINVLPAILCIFALVGEIARHGIHNFTSSLKSNASIFFELLQDLAELTGRLVIERLKSTLQLSASSSQSNSSCIYAETALLSLANAVTSGLAGSRSPSLSDWVLTLSRTLIGSFFMNPSTSTWAQSKALTVAVFECLFNCFKSDKTVVSEPCVGMKSNIW